MPPKVKLTCSIPGCNAVHAAKGKHFPKVYFRRINGKETRVAQICMKCVRKGRRIEASAFKKSDPAIVEGEFSVVDNRRIEW